MNIQFINEYPSKFFGKKGRQNFVMFYSMTRLNGFRILGIKLFSVISYECDEKARVFVVGKPFQPSLIFARKAPFTSFPIG
jgi:hypothetical protein